MRRSWQFIGVTLSLIAVAGCVLHGPGREGVQARTMNAHKHTNQLISETSPYLLQHAHNPVDWHPWGSKAFKKASEEKKPIFLSIGYSSCHWCHVMERESFENEDIARALNEHFVPVKVDREERPDVDEIYMMAVQGMTGSGGWPLSVFLTPDLKPFFGGTYFPPHDMPGRPGFDRILAMLADAWHEDRDEVTKHADLVAQALRGPDLPTGGMTLTPPDGDGDDVLRDYRTATGNAVHLLTDVFDSARGGFGPAPKFPATASISLLLREHVRTGAQPLVDMATTTLDAMASGGMYDHLGGGFHRYSVDAMWLIPHFEKMLYDNALLSQTYLEAFQATGKQIYREVAKGTLDYVLRDMLDELGGFHSAEDADSEGKEGKFYVWTRDEILQALGEKAGDIFCEYYGVTPSGNFEGKSILHVGGEHATGKAAEDLASLRNSLLLERSKRTRPGKDDKVLAAWNGMMISAFARGYQILEDKRYKVAAERAGDFVLSRMVVDGELHRSFRHGTTRIPGYLDDYANIVNALVDLYETSFDVRWLKAAKRLADQMIARFWDNEGGGFFSTAADHEHLLVRLKSYADGSVPSGNAVAALALTRLARLTDDRALLQRATQVLQAAAALAENHPAALLRMICAGEFYAGPSTEVVIVGNRGNRQTELMLRAVRLAYRPNSVVAFLDEGSEGNAGLGKILPMLAGKSAVSGRATAYVCSDYACRKPVTNKEELAKLLVSTGGSVRAAGR